MEHKVTDTIITGQASSCSSVSLLFHMPAWKTISQVPHCNNLLYTDTKLDFTRNDTYGLIKKSCKSKGRRPSQTLINQSSHAVGPFKTSFYFILINVIIKDVNVFEQLASKHEKDQRPNFYINKKCADVIYVLDPRRQLAGTWAGRMEKWEWKEDINDHLHEELHHARMGHILSSWHAARSFPALSQGGLLFYPLPGCAACWQIHYHESFVSHDLATMHRKTYLEHEKNEKLHNQEAISMRVSEAAKWPAKKEEDKGRGRRWKYAEESCR